jgi:serine/threonine protein kinase
MIRESTDLGVPIEIPLTFGHYTYVKTIGNGSSSVVVLAVNSVTKKQCACKVVSRKALEDERAMQQFVHAIDIMRTQHSPHVVELYDVIYTEQNVFVIMEYCSGGELISLVNDFGALTLITRYRIFSQILRALAFLHANGIAHRDLKPDNVMLDGDQNAKLADFGFSRRVDGDLLMSTPCGSAVYMAPEILMGNEYDGFKADIWSLGVILYILETGCYPWTAVNNIQLFHQITQAVYTFPDKVSQESQELIDFCLRLDPEARPSAAELIRICASRKGREAPVSPLRPIPWGGLGHRARSINLPNSHGALYHASIGRSAVYRHHLGKTAQTGGGEGEVTVLPTLKPTGSEIPLRLSRDGAPTRSQLL